MRSWTRVSHVCGIGGFVVCAATSTHAQLAFTDVTQEVGLAAHYKFVQLGTGDLATDSLPGFAGAAAAGDLDFDGWTDLVLTGGPDQPDCIYFNNQDGTFTCQPLTASATFVYPAASSPAGSKPQQKSLSWVDHHFGECIALGDYDSDGLLDVYVLSLGRMGALGPGHHRLWHNEGGRRFREVAVQAGLDATSPHTSDGTGAAFGDYDLDGDLDLVTTGWRTGSECQRLFRNEGDGTFSDQTVASGIKDMVIEKGFNHSFADMDGDRYPELVATCDFGLSRYLVNDGDGTFTDLTTSSGTFLDTNGMGQTIFDFDGDGLFDIYRSSIDAPPTKTGNMLYQNLGGHTYAEVSGPMGVNAGHWGWGNLASDLDNDGWEDLLEVNGWRLPGFVDDPARLWLNDAGTGFTEVSQSVGFVSGHQGRGLTVIDFDRDGDEDVLVTRNGSPAQLFRNDLQSSNHYLRIYLDTSSAPHLAPHGVGSRVVVEFGGRRAYRYVYGRNTFMGQSEYVAHVGLGAASEANVTVEWADGTTTTKLDVQGSRYMILKP